ncbi:MAG TPA: acyl-CoA dehydrogenase family protein [Longimicrobium sp.]|jgi:alkylation response protein AidB-like acyl-CoA dehydrogenase|uniref:acyl-CoA dehydrogenase family protein n=1 Tax=Longimicrobium sp. TaxID=2029185 RepID=UPI002EDABD84
MPDRTFLSWPFFDEEHRAFAAELQAWTEEHVPPTGHAHQDVDAACRALVRQLGAGGWLRHAVTAPYGGARERLDVRTLCLSRETLAHAWGLADFAFAMQGLGAGPITLFGSDALRERYLPAVAAGEAIAAFALSEPDAGSDVAAMQTVARRADGGFVIDGTKTWISNAGIADHYVVFCRFPEAGERGYAAFVVDADNPGLRISERIDVIAPHPLGTLELRECRVGADALVGEAGTGMRVALGTLDVFRTTVGAAALGFARRALDEAVAWTARRQAFGKALREFQLTQSALGQMALEVDASALLVYRAAWTRDSGADRVTREAAMAKLYATEAAQRVIDTAVQLFGGRGVVSGAPVESLYREIRALRIYEGTSEIQKLVIAGQLLKDAGPTAAREG